MEQSAAPVRSGRFHYLDGLRGVAAICVVILHFHSFLEPIRMPGAYLAVDFFFLMSGFVIARTYDDRLATGLSPWRFMVVRLIRLYPMYILGIAISVAPVLAAMVLGFDLLWTPATFAIAAGPAVLMLPSPPIPGKGDHLFPLNVPAWSLFFELISNLLFAVGFRWLKGRGLTWALILSLPPLIAVPVLLGAMDGGVGWHDAWGGLPRVAFSFLLGVLISRNLERLPALRGRWAAWALFVLIPLIMVADLHGPARQIFDLICVVVVFPAAVVIAVRAPEPRRTGWMTVLGDLSYPVYAIHVPIYALTVGLGAKLAGTDLTQMSLPFGIALLAGVIVAAWVLGKTYDVWTRRLLTRLTR